MLNNPTDSLAAQDLLSTWLENRDANCDLIPWESDGMFYLSLHDETGKHEIDNFAFTTEQAANAGLTFALDCLKLKMN